MIRPNKPTNEEKAIRYVLLNNNGFSEREGVFNLNFTSGRNYITDLERKLGIKFNREWEKTADGQGQYYRYTVPDRKTAEMLSNYANAKAFARGDVAITEEQKQRILSRFEQ